MFDTAIRSATALLTAALAFPAGASEPTPAASATPAAPAASATPAASAGAEIQNSNPAQAADSGTSRWTKHVMLRGELLDPRLDKRLFAPAIASQSLLLDFNLTGKKEFSESLRMQADVDLHVRQYWNYRKINRQTGAADTSQNIAADNPEYRLSLNELYVNGNFRDDIQFTAGKKRILWGTGFAANPTDLLNPAKNPLDPTNERRGAWVVQAERIQEHNTIAFFVAPGIEESKHTLPEQVIFYKDSSGKRNSHYLLGWRYYTLLGGADINLMLFNSERYQDDMARALKTGASWSQILTAVSKQLEGHAEFLLQQGSVRPTAAGVSRTDSRDFYIRGLAGFRYDFENESSMLVELSHQADGDSLTDLQRRMQNAQMLAIKYPALAEKPSLPVLMRNTLYLNYQRYKFNDDTFLSWSFAHNLHDHSGYQGPLLQWNPTQTTSLTLSASSDYNLVKNSGVVLAGTGRIRTNELNPAKSRLGLEVKSFF